MPRGDSDGSGWLWLLLGAAFLLPRKTSLAAPPAPVSPPSGGGGARLLPPLSSRRETTSNGFWGAQRDGGKRQHLGNDYKAQTGELIYAPISGRIKLGASRCKRGFVILGDNNTNVIICVYDYAGRAERGQVLFPDGMRVGAGWPVAIVGTEPFVHIGITVNGQYVNPGPLIGWA